MLSCQLSVWRMCTLFRSVSPPPKRSNYDSLMLFLSLSLSLSLSLCVCVQNTHICLCVSLITVFDVNCRVGLLGWGTDGWVYYNKGVHVFLSVWSTDVSSLDLMHAPVHTLETAYSIVVQQLFDHCLCIVQLWSFALIILQATRYANQYYSVPVPSQDKLGALQQKGHSA